MKEEVFEYDKNGRLLYHPALHKRQGKEWTEEEMEYLCKFHEVDETATIALALDRVQTSCTSKLMQLRKNGMYEYYRNLDKYFVSLGIDLQNVRFKQGGIRAYRPHLQA